MSEEKTTALRQRMGIVANFLISVEFLMMPDQTSYLLEAELELKS